MRVSRSSSRKVASRRAYRPDRHVYRSLRQAGMRRSRSLLWIEITLILLAVLAVVLLIAWVM